MSTRPVGSSHSLWLPLLLIGLGVALRALRLEWQPLWWDEGYSVYFATESLAEMARLTAQDIHPPLYYALLHLWLLLWGTASPLALRTFSVLIGLLSLPAIWWLARTLAPRRVRAAHLALLLLALSPMHIFYSQEVRMYGLEMLLGIVSTGLFWPLLHKDTGGETSRRGRPDSLWLGYVAATTALLYTEYYAALLPLAHFIWALWALRGRPDALGRLLAAWGGVALLFLPWMLYALPQLVPYVSQKVVEDADRPLGLIAYGLRHLIAFTSGHVEPIQPALVPIPWLGLAGGALLLLAGVAVSRSRTRRADSPASPGGPAFSATGFVALLLLFPLAVGFLLNLRLPFFPEGGERVLLFVLPYFLLLLALLTDRLRAAALWTRMAAGIGLVALLAAAAAGVWSFYTVPRYVEDDYRPLIRQTVQQGAENDTVLAVFPWQVGYWRAYAPVWGRGELHGPWPLLSPSPAWDDSVRAAIDDSLGRGKLWFPAHLALGGILEGEIEAYLRGGGEYGVARSGGAARTVLNFTNRWYGAGTRLSGWLVSAPPLSAAREVDFSVVRLMGAGQGAERVEAANRVVPVALQWQEIPQDDLRVTLRLEDDAGRVYAQRDYAPLGSWPVAGRGQPASEWLGLLIPPGTPRGDYRLTVGVGPADEEWLYLAGEPPAQAETVEIGRLQVRPPDEPLPLLRLPMQIALDKPVDRSGVAFLGVSGFDPAVATLAGAEMNLSLFARSGRTASSAWDVYVSLLDGDGAGVAGWEGWPLPDYPLPSWPTSGPTRLPISFYLPASLTPGEYRLVAGLLDSSTGEKSAPVVLGQLPIARRAASYEPAQPQIPLDPAPRFGSHALLDGYDLHRAADGSIGLTLHWRVEQTLLPPHQVFVHLRDREGGLVAQNDGVPGRNAIAAPSNTWLPGEVIVDPHSLLPPGPLAEGATVQVGLYIPTSGVRLPVSVDGAVVGDAFTIPLR